MASYGKEVEQTGRKEGMNLQVSFVFVDVVETKNVRMLHQFHDGNLSLHLQQQQQIQ